MLLSGHDLRTGSAGDEVAELHVELKRLGSSVPSRERRDRRFGAGTVRAVAAFQREQGLPDTGVVDGDTAAALTRAVAARDGDVTPPTDEPESPALDGPEAPPPTPVPVPAPGGAGGIAGTVYLEYGVPAADVTLQAYRKGFGGETVALGPEVRTDRDGRYRIRFDTDGGPVNLELRARLPRDSDNDPFTWVALTSTVFDVAPGDVLNVVAPTAVRPLSPERDRLLRDIDSHLHGLRLGAARETTEQPDLTLLQESTGWDARLVALAASAEHVTAQTGGQNGEQTGVPLAAAYAMLRAGLPDDPVGLAGVSKSAVDRALTEADAAGVVSLTKAQREAALEAFVVFRSAERLNAVAPGALSSQGEMLTAAGLGSDAAAQFDDIVERAGTDTTQLWADAQAAGLPVETLRRTGKLGYLTLNNAVLTTHLQDTMSADLGPSLAGARLYDPQAWVQLLTDVAGGNGDALAALVPPAYRAGHGDPVHAYADELARKVRVGYPTNVVGHRLGAGELPLPGTDETERGHVATVLDRAAGRGFALGRASVSTLLREHGEALLAGVPEARRDAVTAGVRTLQRTYQITPSDAAMTVLLRNDLRSAHDVTAMSHESFLRRHGGEFRTTEEASLVYAKAQQVSATTLAVCTAAKQLDSAPLLFALGGPTQARDAARTDLIQTFPTMEQLFGPLDYCACAHCRSVLSPAAYLADLLHFLDPPADASATEPAPAPFEVLAGRRPDLPNLPLTCENTNTALPYVDVVNEILEYYVAHGRLTPGAVRDTGRALAADLLAEPQNLIPEAYGRDRLGGAGYPLVLPFDLWLETVRRLLDHFETPLWQVLEAFRRTEALYPARTEPYGQAAVAIERLGPSGAEYELLTDRNPVPRWYERYGYPSAAAAAELSTAATLADRLGVSYQELLDLMATGFVNPRLAAAPVLTKLGIGVVDVLRYQGAPGHPPFSAAERADFEILLESIGGPSALDGLFDADDLAHILVLADPDAGGGFDTTTVQYADGTPADPIAFLLLNYLVRLCRRLGWSLTETDRALRVFLPTEPDPRTDGGLGPAMASALLGLSRLDALTPLLKGDRDELLELWSDLPAARYAGLFLVPGTPPVDATFDEPLGHYLQDPDVPLAGHVGTVQSALRLSADDVTAILADAGTTLEAAPLDMPTVSLLHRYGVLARGLRMPVADMIALRQLSGLDPFAPPPPGPVTTPAQDHASATVTFVEAVLAVRDSGVAVAEVDYLLRHRYDPAGPYLTAAEAPLALVRSLDAEILRIATEQADPVEPSLVSDEDLRASMALVLPVDVVETFFGMWTGTISTDVEEPGAVPESDQLKQASVATEPAVTLTYDLVLGRQHLTYRGVLFPAERNRLVAAYPDDGTRDRYAALLDAVQQVPREFFDLNLVTPVGFLGSTDYAGLFTPPVPDTDDDRKRRTRLVEALVPYVRDRLIDQSVLATVGAEFPDAADVVTALLTEPPLVGEALVPAYRAAGERGLTETQDAETAVVDGYVEVTTAGAYTFFVTCAHAGTSVELRFDHLTDAPLLTSAATDGEEKPSLPVDLSPGSIYHLRLEASSTGGGAVTVNVQGPNLAKGSVERLTCHPADAVGRVRRAHVLLDKSLRLAAAAELTEPELRHVLTHPDDFGGLALARLPVSEADDTPERARRLFGQLLRLLELAALRREMGAAPGELTDLFAHARQSYPTGPDAVDPVPTLLADLQERLAVLTRRDTATVAEATDLLHLTATASVVDGVANAVAPGLVDEIGLRRLWTVLSLSGRLGVTPTTLATAATPTPGEPVARALRDAVHAGYDVVTWRRVAKPIFDALRRCRRDALVAWVMHENGFDRIEQLYEYFLLDPGSEPVVQTSRLRLAISAVQLFVQRCLLSLEPEVPPSAINSEHWVWMKRYRVWEANRKIFLWPENWLEPEFRDDKSHLFEALESSLFAGDVTDDLAEDALFGYLRSLETLARLDIRALYVEEKDDPGANVLHVVGRTFGAPHRYFYRTYEWGMWTPWVPVTTEIEGDHLVAAVWRERLHLFWVTFLERAEPATETTVSVTDDGIDSPPAPPRVIDTHLHWTEYYQGEWADPSSSPVGAPITTVVDRYWSPADERVHMTHDGDALLVHVNVALIFVRAGVDISFRIEGKNSAPEEAAALAPPAVPYSTSVRGMDDFAWGPLTVDYVDRITDGPALGTRQEHTATARILDAYSQRYTLRVVAGTQTSKTNPDNAVLVSPLFYQDDKHTFHVEPALTETALTDYDGWVIPSVTAQSTFDQDLYWDRLDLFSQVPTGDTITLGSVPGSAIYQVEPRADWVTDIGTTIAYEGSAVLGHSATNGGRVPTSTRRPRPPRPAPAHREGT